MIGNTSITFSVREHKYIKVQLVLFNEGYENDMEIPFANINNAGSGRFYLKIERTHYK